MVKIGILNRFIRNAQAVLFNTEEDGSGDWLFPTVTADGEIIVNAALTAATIDVDSTGATDDAAAAGALFAAAGLYQATVDELDDGDLGRLRANIRRVLMVAGDAGEMACFNSGGTGGATDGDIRDTSNHEFNFPVEARHARRRVLALYNGLDQNVSVLVQFSTSSISVPIYLATLNAGAKLVLIPGLESAGNYVLEGETWLDGVWPSATFLRVTAAGTPTSGAFTAHLQWSSL